MVFGLKMNVSIMSLLANINDRSMLGDRDSEVCILVKDEEMVRFVSELAALIHSFFVCRSMGP